MLIITDKVQIPLSEIEFTFVRSSGPGGQNVNKVASKAVLRWNVRKSPALPLEVITRFLKTFKNRITKEGDIILTSDQFREQSRNQVECLDKLRDMVYSVLFPPKIRIKTKKSYSQKQKNLTSKRTHSSKKRLRQKSWSED